MWPPWTYIRCDSLGVKIIDARQGDEIEFDWDDGNSDYRVSRRQFDHAVTQTGVGNYFISSAVPGAQTDGTVQLTYDLYSLSPNNPDFDPGADLVSSGNTISALASVSVSEASTDTPEPAFGFGAGLMGIAIAGWLLKGRSRAD